MSLVSPDYRVIRAHLVIRVILDRWDHRDLGALRAPPVFLVTPAILASLVSRVKPAFLALVALRGIRAYPPALVLP